MTILARVRSFLRAAVRRSRMEREMDDELRFHLDARVEDLIASGRTPVEAVDQARREFGDPLRWKEAGREARGLRFVDEIRTDGAYAIRWLRRSPGFTTAVVMSMAIGIGANTAIFSLVNTVLLTSLPVADPQELVLLGASNDDSGLGSSFPYPFYRQLRDAPNEVLAGVIASASAGPSVEADGYTERVSGELVSGNYFDVLGVRPHAGRLFTQQDDRTPGAHPVVVLDYRYWQRRFGGDGAVIGRTIHVNTHPMVIIGVTPPDFHGIEPGAQRDLRVPMSMQVQMDSGRVNVDRRGPPTSRLDSPGHWWLQILARTQSNVSQAQVSDVINAVFAQFKTANAIDDDALRVVVLDGSAGRPTIRKRFLQPLLVLTMLVAIVLILVCVNVANLMLARAAARQRELSVRLALGAGRGRIARQLLVEATLLAGAGGAVGLLISLWVARGLAVLSAGADAPVDVGVDFRVFGYATALSIATGVVCGLVPALITRRIDLVSALNLETRHMTTGHFRGRQALVVAQIALSLTLLIGAGLFGRTLSNLHHLDPGFTVDNLVSLNVNPTLSGYNQERMRLFYEELLSRVQQLSSVRSATVAVMPVLGQNRWGSGLTLDAGVRDDNPGPLRNGIGPHFFSTIGIPIRGGREFTPADTAAAPSVAIVNAAFVRKYFSGASAIGRRIGPGGPKGVATVTIVGVVADSRQVAIHEASEPFWYVPLAQLRSLGELTLHARTSGDADAVLEDLKRVVATIDKGVTAFGATSVRRQIDEQVVRERLLAVLSSSFAVLAALLASLGLYGVMTYVTSMRTREIGVRMALGASPRMIFAMMLGHTLLLIALGIGAGLALVLGLVGSVRSLLFGIEPTDPITIAAAAALLFAVAAAAAMMPVARATRVSPVTALQ